MRAKSLAVCVSIVFGVQVGVCEKRDDCAHSHPILFSTYQRGNRDWTSLTDLLSSTHTCPRESFMVADKSNSTHTLHSHTCFLFHQNIYSKYSKYI